MLRARKDGQRSSAKYEGLPRKIVTQKAIQYSSQRTFNETGIAI